MKSGAGSASRSGVDGDLADCLRTADAYGLATSHGLPGQVSVGEVHCLGLGVFSVMVHGCVEMSMTRDVVELACARNAR